MQTNIRFLKSLVSEWMLSHLKDRFKELTNQEFNYRLEEFLKYIFLCSKYGGGFIPLSKEVDEFWHEYIVQTEEYLNLCSSLPSKNFIHHKSGNLKVYAADRDSKSVILRMLQWLPTYYIHFGPFKEEIANFWTIIQYLQKELKMDLAAINEIAKMEAKKLEARV